MIINNKIKILYLDDYINYYDNRIIIYKTYDNVLKNGHIIDKNKFIKAFKDMLKKNNIKQKLFNQKITIIINNNYSKEDKVLLKDIFEELNYNKVIFISENDIFNNNKKYTYINCNYSYINISYVKDDGKLEYLCYKNNYINKEILNTIIKMINKDVILYGKNINEIINILDNDIKYYKYDDNNNTLIKLLLEENVEL